MRTLYSCFIMMVISSIAAFASATVNSFNGLDDLDGRTGLLMSRCVVQDESGMIWLGTTKGLYSYDGYELDKNLPVGQRFINAMVVRNGLIYIGYNDGMGIYDLISEELQSVDFFAGSAVHAFVISEDSIYVGASSGLYRYPWKDAHKPSRIERLSNREVFSIGRKDNELWIGTIEGLGCYSIHEDKLKNIELGIFKDSNIKVATFVLPKDDSSIWVGTPSALLCYNQSEDKEEVFPLPVLKTIINCSGDDYYVGTDDGLYYFDRSKRKLEKVNDCVAWHSMKDKSGNIWLATDNGLLVKRRDKGLKTIDTGGNPEAAVYNGLLRDKRGRIWAWSSYGILRYESDNMGGYRLVRHYSMGEDPYQIPHNRVNTIVEDKRDGSLYVATDGGNLRYNESTGHFDRYGIIDTYNWIYDILIDGNLIWYASYDGLFCMRDNEVKERYTHEDGLSTDDIAQVIKDKNGCIWMRTRDRNVYTLNPISGELARFPVEEYASSGFCEDILSDIAGNIWLAVQNKLVHVSLNSGARDIETYELEAFDLPDVYSMSSFLGKIWVCTSQGIYMFDTKSHEVKNLYPGARYVSIQYDYREDNILLGGVGDISYFSVDNLDNFIKDGHKPVYVTSVIVNGRNRISTEELHNGKLVLGYNENNISISLSDFTYEDDAPSRFRMTMNHKNMTWDESISGNTVFLPNLSPGRYSLSFSSGSAQSGSENGSLEIKISHPWYSSTPMLIVYFLAFAGMIMLIIHLFTMKRFLTLEKEQRKVLIEQSRQKEAFFGNVAHEFKTPLSLIIAPLSKLINECQDDESRTILKMAHENATKINSLIHNTIDYYRDPESSGFTVIKSEVEFVEFARTIFNSFRSNFPNHEFIFESMPEKIITEVDAVKMEMVLTNLMSNACKYTPDGGSVIMIIEEDCGNGRFFLKLSDTGIGIPKEELHLVFQRYFESSRSKGGHYDSTGIGLSLIKDYVQIHEGTVSVDSDDMGTTFTIMLPCKPLETGMSEPNDGSPADMDKPLIVIVDDNPQLCTFLEASLKKKYRCISSNNGKSGLKLCKDVVPDLIISDVMMPVMDGMEMCRQLREYLPLSTVPIILLTAKSDRITEEQSIQLNIDTFVPKPFEFSTLSARIDQLIGNRHRMEHKLRVEMISSPADADELSLDEKYLKRVTQIIEEHIDDDTLSVKKLCAIGNFNEKQLYRRTKQLTGMSTVEYIRSIRLKKAAILLQKGNFTVSEVMYSVGFNNASYFTRAFSAEYGKTPSDYLKSYKKR